MVQVANLGFGREAQATSGRALHARLRQWRGLEVGRSAVAEDLGCLVWGGPCSAAASDPFAGLPAHAGTVDVAGLVAQDLRCA